MANKMHVWWYPQVGTGDIFYVPVKTPEEGKRVMDILATYDCFQYNHNIKPDYCNTGGLSVFNEESGEWEDWYSDDGLDLDDYCETASPEKDALRRFTSDMMCQVHFD